MKQQKKHPCKLPHYETDALVVHPALRSYLSYSFYKAAIHVKTKANAALQARHGIVGPQLGMLRLLELLGPTSQVELGRSMGVDKATMVKFIDELEGAGWVNRLSDAADRRVKRVQITGAGKRFLAKAAKTRQEVEGDFFAPLSAAERKLFGDMVGRLLR